MIWIARNRWVGLCLVLPLACGTVVAQETPTKPIWPGLTKAGTVVIASDNVYAYDNLEKHVPIAATLDAKSNLAAQDRMKKIASNPRLIIPSHDPEVFVRFPKPGNGVARLE